MSDPKEDARLSLIVVAISLAITTLIVATVQKDSVYIQGVSVVGISAIVCFGVQWLAWAPASFFQTERFYDLTGGLTYVALTAITLWGGSTDSAPGPREVIVSLLVAVWSIRLSGFLFLRIHHAGKDGRFDDLKTSPTRFVIPWTLQALWVFITMNVVIVINSQSGPSPPLGAWDAIGLLLWVTGFAIEVIADRQKTQFNSIPENEGKWIGEGLWAVSRHPNYMGETILWLGMAFFGVACFTGLEFLAWISPLFVYFLLTRISGVPILDRRAMERWGGQPEYLEYREKTPEIFPFFK